MSTIHKEFEELLSKNMGEEGTSPKFTKDLARKLLDRIKHIKLYAHSYAFTLHFQHGVYHAIDLLNFAHQQGLSGIDIHLHFGNERSLKNKSMSELKEVKELAKKLNLKIVLEVTDTTKSDIQTIVKIAKILDAQNIRVYNRYGGYLSDNIQKCISDLKYACELADKEDLYFVIEQHEVLKSTELVHIIKEVDSSRLGLLFDLGNMINANERPLAALKIMSPYIRHVHIKDVKVISNELGFAHEGVPDGQGDLPQLRMIYDLLMLGDKKPQVKIFALEQSNGYFAPAYRFKGEGKNPRIPKRTASHTRDNPKLSRDENLRLEKENAVHQVTHIKKLLDELREVSERRLESKT